MNACMIRQFISLNAYGYLCNPNGVRNGMLRLLGKHNGMSHFLPPCEPQVRHDLPSVCDSCPILPTERASPKAHSDGATGGVCKEQGRIHRAMMTRGY